MSSIIIWTLLAVMLTFVLVFFVGAPYVPTHKKAIAKILDMLPLKKGDLVVDLGSGDGEFLLAAAKKGYRGLGYEINPFLWVVSKLRLAPHRKQVSVKLTDFWQVKLPGETKAVFVFLVGPFMPRLARKLSEVMVGRSQPLFVVSYGFEVPGLKPVESLSGIHLYKLMPTKR